MVDIIQDEQLISFEQFMTKKEHQYFSIISHLLPVPYLVHYYCDINISLVSHVSGQVQYKGQTFIALPPSVVLHGRSQRVNNCTVKQI